MELEVFLFLVGILLLVAAYIFHPFFGTQRRTNRREDHRRSNLLAEKERLLKSLQELDFDFQLGKIDDGDFGTQRSKLISLGAHVLKELDSLPCPAVQERMDPLKQSASIDDEEIENLISRRRANRKEKMVGFCPACGKAVLLSDHFCPGCGKELG